MRVDDNRIGSIAFVWYGIFPVFQRGIPHCCTNLPGIPAFVTKNQSMCAYWIWPLLGKRKRICLLGECWPVNTQTNKSEENNNLKILFILISDEEIPQ